MMDIISLIMQQIVSVIGIVEGLLLHAVYFPVSPDDTLSGRCLPSWATKPRAWVGDGACPRLRSLAPMYGIQGGSLKLSEKNRHLNFSGPAIKLLFSTIVLFQPRT